MRIELALRCRFIIDTSCCWAMATSKKLIAGNSSTIDGVILERASAATFFSPSTVRDECLS